MGTFSFTYDDEEREKVLEFWEFQKLLGLPFHEHYYRWQDLKTAQAPQIAFPTITAAEICDKARGDFLSTAIVILQMLWFIIQCIARSKQGLALTELELVTLALASLNGVVYFLWWNKPLGVNEPVKLYRRGKGPAEMLIGEEGSRDDVSTAIFSNVLGIYWISSDASSALRILRNAVSSRSSSTLSVPFDPYLGILARRSLPVVLPSIINFPPFLPWASIISPKTSATSWTTASRSFTTFGSCIFPSIGLCGSLSK